MGLKLVVQPLQETGVVDDKHAKQRMRMERLATVVEAARRMRIGSPEEQEYEDEEDHKPLTRKLYGTFFFP